MQFLSFIERLIRKLRTSKYGWRGDYKDWKNAQVTCGGYDAANILERIKTAALKVKAGEALYERDSILFSKVEYSWPLLSALMWIAALNKGKLKVIDFGGSLGSSYFQNRQFLDTLDFVKWNVIEQPSFVQCGQNDMQDERLQFFYSVDEAIKQNGLPDILVIACTLPYIEQPYLLMKNLMTYGIPYLIIDNTPFYYKSKDRITVQNVPPSIYEASYPCWLLDYNNIIQSVQKRYSIITEHQNDSYIYVDGKKIQYKGFLAKIKTEGT